METLLFNAYQIFSVFLFLFLSVLLIYHRLFNRWLKFSLGFFVVYLLGSYFFFGKVDIPFASEKTLRAIPYFLFFFGSVACIGYCLFKQLGLWQSIGLLICWFFALLVVVFLSGGSSARIGFSNPTTGWVEDFLASMPYIIFYIGSPLVLGYGLYRELGLRQTTGLYLVFCFFVLLTIVGASNYFNRPFGFFYELSPHARAWIEIGSILVLMLGLIAVIGYCLLHSYTGTESVGAIIVFLVVMAAVMVTIQLTMGYQILGQALARAL